MAPVEVGGTGGGGWHQWRWVAPGHQKGIGDFSPFSSPRFEGDLGME